MGTCRHTQVPRCVRLTPRHTPSRTPAHTRGGAGEGARAGSLETWIPALCAGRPLPRPPWPRGWDQWPFNYKVLPLRAPQAILPPCCRCLGRVGLLSFSGRHGAPASYVNGVPVSRPTPQSAGSSRDSSRTEDYRGSRVCVGADVFPTRPPSSPHRGWRLRHLLFDILSLLPR